MPVGFDGRIVYAPFRSQICAQDPDSWPEAAVRRLKKKKKQNGCHPPPNVLPWFGTLWLPISKNEIEAERSPVWYHCGNTGGIAESAWHSDRKWLPGSVPKMETVGLVSTCGRELLRGWQQPIGLMVSFAIFTASVRKICDTILYINGLFCVV
jgi:hypothetical protein